MNKIMFSPQGHQLFNSRESCFLTQLFNLTQDSELTNTLSPPIAHKSIFANTHLLPSSLQAGSMFMASGTDI